MNINNILKILSLIMVSLAVGFLISSCVAAQKCRNICAPSEECKQKCMTEYEWKELNGY